MDKVANLALYGIIHQHFLEVLICFIRTLLVFGSMFHNCTSPSTGPVNRPGTPSILNYKCDCVQGRDWIYSSDLKCSSDSALSWNGRMKKN